MADRTGVRPAAVAGMFYDADPAALEADLRGMLHGGKTRLTGPAIRAIVAPHAGYQYSGPTAAAAYAELEGSAVRRVIIVAPSHREYFDGISVYPGSAYRTPLGDVPVDTLLRDRLLALCKGASLSPSGHGQEHAIEVQLPFLQQLLPSLKFLPVVVGHQSRENCYGLGDALGLIAREADVLLVASCDLSHYHPAGVADRLDRVFIEDLESGDEERLMSDLESGATEACGGGPVVALMRALRVGGGGRFSPIRHATSGDITGDRSSVVGYLSAAAYA